MMQSYNIPFIFLHVSTLLTFLLLFFIIKMKNKKNLHYFSFGMDFVVFLWCAFSLMEQYATQNYNYSGMFFTNWVFSAIAFVSVFLFFFGYSFAHSDSPIPKYLYLLFIVPVVCVILIWTNDLHHLYFIHYSQINSEFKKGIILQLHPIFSYGMIIFGLFYLIKFSIRNSGFISRQSLLIIIGTLFPVAVDIAYVANIYSFPVYFEPISFSFAVICFMISIFRFNFLSIVPIALQTVVDHISDAYLVLNDRMEITDYNKPFADNFQGIASIKRKVPFDELFSDDVSEQTNAILEKIKNNITDQKQCSFEVNIKEKQFDKYFIVEITPVVKNGTIVCTIILFKDITEQKKDAELISKTQVMLIESEHLASLGQLVGGIAHNLKTPIMSISGGLEGLTELITEYDESVEDEGITAEDHREIAGEMRVWIAKLKEYTAYMSDIISTVKGQAVQLTASTTDKFTLKELVKRVEILMNHELKRFSCKLDIRCQLDKQLEIKGEINSFVQVINNLIINGIEAYDGREGVIELTITKEEEMVRFEIKDSGSGMTEDVQNRLFKEMITTKAKNGTGLGLYMSYSTITGRFGGKMWFESVYGMGTTFYIMIPAV